MHVKPQQLQVGGRFLCTLSHNSQLQGGGGGERGG